MAHSDGQLHLDMPAAICLAFALLVQIGTNFANDYLDGIKGTDTDARLGPRRAVAAGLVSASTMKWAAIGILAFAFCLGLEPDPLWGLVVTCGGDIQCPLRMVLYWRALSTGLQWHGRCLRGLIFWSHRCWLHLFRASWLCLS